jgi:glutathione peroxidase
MLTFDHFLYNFLFNVLGLEAGLEILAFPCNQFGEQEPGSNDQITEFVCTRFKSEFPIFDKVDLRLVELCCIYALTAAF